MRWLACGVVLTVLGGPAAWGDGLARLTAAQVTAQNLDDCFDRAYQPGRDKPGDGGRSQKRLLDACSSEWEAAIQACRANTGKSIGACRKQTGNLAGDYLGLKGTLQ